jgi:uncharacterized protein DUF3489
MNKSSKTPAPTVVGRKAMRKAPRGASPKHQAPRTPAASTSQKPSVRQTSKLATVIALLRRPKGASIDDLCKATGWQAHSVRGALSGAIKKKLGLAVESRETDGARVYRVTG